MELEFSSYVHELVLDLVHFYGSDESDGVALLSPNLLSLLSSSSVFIMNILLFFFFYNLGVVRCDLVSLEIIGFKKFVNVVKKFVNIVKVDLVIIFEIR